MKSRKRNKTEEKVVMHSTTAQPQENRGDGCPANLPAAISPSQSTPLQFMCWA